VPRSAALPGMQHDLALSYGQIGVLLGIPVLVAAVLEPLMGLAGDTHWRRSALPELRSTCSAACTSPMICSGANMGRYALLLVE